MVLEYFYYSINFLNFQSLLCFERRVSKNSKVIFGVPDILIAQKSLCLVVFSVKAQNELSDLKYTFLVVANNNKMIDYLSKRIIKLF